MTAKYICPLLESDNPLLPNKSTFRGDLQISIFIANFGVQETKKWRVSDVISTDPRTHSE